MSFNLFVLCLDTFWAGFFANCLLVVTTCDKQANESELEILDFNHYHGLEVTTFDIHLVNWTSFCGVL